MTQHSAPCPPRLVVVWRINEACNLACGFCGYSREVVRPRASASAEQVRALGAEQAAYGRAQGRAVLVSWLGGEPFLWRPLLGISRDFKRELGLQVAVTTNGIALRSARVRRALCADFAQLTVSVDGLGAFHDAVRGRAGLFDELRANVMALSELKARMRTGPLMRVNTILMRDNVEQFEALCVALAGWGVEEVTFNALGGRDRPDFFARHRLLPAHAAWLREELPAIRARMARLGLSVCGSEGYSARIVQAIEGVPAPVADCEAGQRYLFVDERGRVAPCSFTLEEYGQATEDIHALPGMFAARRREKRAAACANCVSTNVFGKFE